MMRRLLLYLFVVGVFLLSVSPLHARERVQGWCEQGGNALAVIGSIVTADKAQQSFPGCTITVWAAGTVDLSTIFSDDVGTIKANPFTADATTGLWFFYADNARYDVQLSGAGISTPFTLADWLLDDAAQTSTTVSNVTFSATPEFNVGKASILTITLTGNVTSSTITNGVTGQVIRIYIAQDGTGGRTFVFPANVQLRKGGYTIASDASGVSVIALYFDGTNWRELSRDPDDEFIGKWNNIRVVDGLRFTIATAVANVSTNGTVYVSDGISETLSAVLTINKPLVLWLGRNVTVTCGMTIVGPATGCIDITSSDVEIRGSGSTSLLTQSNAQNIQTLIHIHGNSRIKFSNFKIDGNEDNQTDPTFDNGGTAFYTGIRSSLGGSEVTIEEMEITRAGSRAIDIRGTDRVWILYNYIHDTGLNIAGEAAIAASSGNALSVSIDGTTPSNDVWVIGNLFEQWGDSVEVSHGRGAHFIGNILKGRRFFGNTPRDDEGGIGLTGAQDAEVIGNQVYDVRLRYLSATAQVTTPNSIPRNIQVVGNLFKDTAAGGAGEDSAVTISHGAQNLQLSGIEFSNNRLEGVRAIFGGIDGLTITGNTFLNTTNSGPSEIGLSLNQPASGGVLTNFVIANNVFDSDNNTMDVAGINIDTSVTTPGSAFITNNSFGSGVPNDIVVGVGALNKIAIRRRNLIELHQSSPDAVIAVARFNKSRGTNAAPATVLGGDPLGRIRAFGHDGINYIESSKIEFDTGSPIAAGQVPGIMRFFTANASGTLTEAWSFDASQRLIPAVDGLDIGTPSIRPDVHALKLSVHGSVSNDSGGLKHIRFGATCTTAATAGATCTTVYSWTTAFADASYTPVCWGRSPSGTPTLQLNESGVAASITVRVTAITAVASKFFGVHCIAPHD